MFGRHGDAVELHRPATQWRCIEKPCEGTAPVRSAALRKSLDKRSCAKAGNSPARELLRKEMLRNGLDECCMETERHR